MGLPVSESDLEGAVRASAPVQLPILDEGDDDGRELAPENDALLDTLIIDDGLKNKEESPYYSGLEGFFHNASSWVAKTSKAVKTAIEQTAHTFEKSIGHITLGHNLRDAMDVFIDLESKGRNIQAIQNGSHATSCVGILQFSKQTWLGYVKKYGAQHGMGEWANLISGSPGRYTVANGREDELLNGRYDQIKVLAMESELIAEADAALQKHGLETSVRNRYAIHFAGPAGVNLLLAEKNGGQDRTAVSILGERDAESNRSMFYHRDGSEITVGEFMASIDGRIDKAYANIQQKGSYVAAITGEPGHPVNTAALKPSKASPANA